MVTPIRKLTYKSFDTNNGLPTVLKYYTITKKTNRDKGDKYKDLIKVIKGLTS